MEPLREKANYIRPLISIITVVFNAGQKLERTVKSVLNQTYGRIEYIVIDGGSEDKTGEIIEKYREGIHYYLSEPDSGIYDAMNKGIRAASGDWIYFLGAGDELLDVLGQLSGFLKDPGTIYYGDVYMEDIKRVYDGEFTAFKLAVKNICHQAIFYPTWVFRLYQFDTRYKLLADHDLNMRCFGDNRLSFKYLSLLICKYEGNGRSASNIDREFVKDKIRRVRENFSLPVYLYVYARRSMARLLKNKN